MHVEDKSSRHHSKYVSGDNVAHRCLMTYLDMFCKMKYKNSRGMYCTNRSCPGQNFFIIFYIIFSIG